MKLPVFYLQQLLIILRQEPVVDQMASLILKTVIIPIRDAIRKVKRPVEIAVLNFFKHGMFRPFEEKLPDLIKAASMSPDKFYKVLDKLPSLQRCTKGT